jgi:hypothetical protein
VHQGGVSVYVKIVDLISLRHQYKYTEHKGKTIKTDGRKLLLDALKLIGSFGLSLSATLMITNSFSAVQKKSCKTAPVGFIASLLPHITGLENCRMNFYKTRY